MVVEVELPDVDAAALEVLAADVAVVDATVVDVTVTGVVEVRVATAAAAFDDVDVIDAALGPAVLRALLDCSADRATGVEEAVAAF